MAEIEVRVALAARVVGSGDEVGIGGRSVGFERGRGRGQVADKSM